MSYLLRLRSKIAPWLIPGSLLAILFLWFIVNVQVQKSRSRIIAELNRCLHQEMQVDNVDYFPPNALSLRNISIIKRRPGDARLSIFISGIRVNFSFWRLVWKRDFRITRVCVNKFKVIRLERPTTDLKGIGRVAADWLSGEGPLPAGGDFELDLRNGFFICPEKQGRLFQFNIATLKLRRSGELTVQGGLGLVAPDMTGDSLGYSISGRLRPETLELNNLELRAREFHAKLWGSVNPEFAELRGFSFLGKSSGYLSAAGDTSRIVSRAQRIVSDLRGGGTQIIWLSSFADLNLLDLECLVKFLPDRIMLTRCDFTLNHVPVSLSGTLFPGEPLLLNLKLLLYSSLQLPRRPFLEGALNGELNQGSLSGQAVLKMRSRSLHLDFTQLRFNPLPNRKLRSSLKHVSARFLSGSLSYEAALSSLESLYVFRKRSLRLAFKSKLNEGKVSGICEADLNKAPLRLRARAIASGFDPAKLGGYLSSYSGVASAAIRLCTYPRLTLEGKIRLSHGRIAGLKFFEGIADFLGVPQLAEVSVQEAEAALAQKSDQLYFNLITFRSPELGLRSAVNINRSGLVSGRASLSVPVELLVASEKFKPLLGLLGKNTENLDLDFQLSGLAENPNFQWLESDFKNRLKNLLPAYMERNLENSVGEAVDPVSGK